MTRDPSSDETILLATFPSWNDAEIARSFLEDEGITSYLTGQEPHRAPELSGVSLRVLQSRAEEAAEALRGADLLPPPASEEDREEAKVANRRLMLWAFAAIFGLILLSLIINVF